MKSKNLLKSIENFISHDEFLSSRCNLISRFSSHAIHAYFTFLGDSDLLRINRYCKKRDLSFFVMSEANLVVLHVYIPSEV